MADHHAAARPEERLAERLRLPLERSPSLRQALMHPSYVNEVGGQRIESNERLEFLGDAVVGLVVAAELYRRYPRRTEGELTVMRAALVRRSTLARWARQLELGELILLGHGEDRAGERDRDSLLAQGFEAVVGAVYLDHGFRRAAALVHRFLRPELEARDPLVHAVDAKSRLQHRSQALFGITPTYQEIEVSGPDHAPTSTVRVTIGDLLSVVRSARGKRAAEQEAARAALEELERTYPSDTCEGRPS